MGLIPQLHNGGAVSQSLAQSCPPGESESHGPGAWGGQAGVPGQPPASLELVNPLPAGQPKL